MADAWVWPVGLGAAGLLIGSFAATVAIRWPEPALAGRSRCDGCGRSLRPWELVPLLSWAMQRGRCRRCGGAIDPLHPLIELAALAIGAVAGWGAPGMAGLAGAVFGWQLLTLATIDARLLRLPRPLTLALAASGVAAGLIVPPPMIERLIGGLAGFGSLWVVAAAYRALKGRDGLGGGDAWLFGAIGLWLGWRALPGVLLVASVAGLVWAILGRKARTDRLPLGTLLAGAAFSAWIFATMGP